MPGAERVLLLGPLNSRNYALSPATRTDRGALPGRTRGWVALPGAERVLLLGGHRFRLEHF